MPAPKDTVTGCVFAAIEKLKQGTDDEIIKECERIGIRKITKQGSRKQVQIKLRRLRRWGIITRVKNTKKAERRKHRAAGVQAAARPNPPAGPVAAKKRPTAKPNAAGSAAPVKKAATRPLGAKTAAPRPTAPATPPKPPTGKPKANAGCAIPRKPRSRPTTAPAAPTETADAAVVQQPETIAPTIESEHESKPVVREQGTD